MSAPSSEREALAALIDHTLLAPDADRGALIEHCREAVRLGVAAACVQPRWLELCVQQLDGSPVAPCTVLAFPHGALPTELKAEQARWASACGARELDMVIDLGSVVSEDWNQVRADIEAVVRAAPSAQIKVILETVLLDERQKRRACECVCEAGARFVKTSTGFAAGGATVEDVKLLRECVGTRVGVKASGGIRTRDQALAMIEAGANRIGSSRSVEILS